MKYCKKCGVLYDSSLPSCPKCNPELLKYQDSIQNAPKADKDTIKKQWIGLCIGIPAFIGIIYLVIYLIKSLNK